MVKAQDVEDLDVKDKSLFMTWLKKIAYIITILTTLSGGIMGVYSFVREVKDPKAQSGYAEHSKMLEENSRNIKENREEIRFLYRQLVRSSLRNGPSNFENREKKLNDIPIQRPRNWDKLSIQMSK